MDWRKEAERDLRRYDSMSESLERIAEQIALLREKKISIRSSWSDSTPVQGGSNRAEDEQINAIVKMDRLKFNYRTVKRLCDLINGALERMSEEDQYILEVSYIHPRHDAIGEIGDKCSVERTKAYELRRRALTEFTLKMYGIMDL